MKPFDDSGRELDAIFSIVRDDDQELFLILESRGGGRDRPRPPRNADYAPAFELLLSRLGEYGVVLKGVEVFSSRTEKWPRRDRQIVAPSFPVPIRLHSLPNVTAFRNEIARASVALGAQPGQKGGNPTKRLRFALGWTDAEGRSVGELENILAKPASAPSEDPTSDPEQLRSRSRSAKTRMQKAGSTFTNAPSGSGSVGKVEASITRYIRDPKVVAWVLLIARGQCEACDQHAPFSGDDDEPFLEVHHVRPLGEGGPDQIDNAIAACPNCHRRLHFGKDRAKFREMVVARLGRLKDYPARESLSQSAGVTNFRGDEATSEAGEGRH